tara:strand:+ start:613 stop:852 length:240 start_codon:yes stop_codon:yes gene_type:complete
MNTKQFINYIRVSQIKINLLYLHNITNINKNKNKTISEMLKVVNNKNSLEKIKLLKKKIEMHESHSIQPFIINKNIKKN